MTGQIPEQVQTPTYPQYTNLALKEGLFDQLMATVEHHLDKQYTSQRIKGTDYAKAYIGSLESVMQNTTQYLLGILLINEQKDKIDTDISLTKKQGEKIEAEIKIIDLQEEQLKFTIEQLLPLEKLKLRAEIDLIAKQESLIDQQILKVKEEIEHMEAQQVLWGKQAEKIDKEILFLTAKISTENANTQAGIAHADSLIGRQMSLLAAQKLGFAGDIQVKSAKLHADYDAIFQSVQEVPEAATLSSNAIAAINNALTTASAIATV